ncbi:glutaminyl-peptide cyclotransferase [Lentzea sp. BCCO 10_0061]|uniref:Glutaminyl-peptide cyclotransferase n=1 Tax=Lentzea sokolovensis TaxID=3095429 RepID=A0ABU4UVJ8_9PSEU|nr:glutaminyl-peptide cyclotransferase [Lentzea sp. BCCO 10_0061]MDX8143532.1 glutaminyl-peptide cyclotransferase [Lentzea sp. BCCO 10_0061]
MRSPIWLVLVAVLAACSTPQEAKPQVEVLQKIPHDTSAFTQGLELVDGVLYEGTGLEGKSTMRALDPSTGNVQKKVDLPPEYFGEGITVVGDTIWQITWQNGIAIERDRKTLNELRRVSYEGEGWGICDDGKQLIMSDGTAKLTFRDPKTFKETGSVQVTRSGQPLAQLNELECVGGKVWSNVWKTDEIVRIDPANGQVTSTYDLSSLKPQGDVDVLNGIAHVPGTDEFLVTGKNWPTIFRVRFNGMGQD